MSDQHMDKHDEQKKNKESNYKKFLLYGILLVLVVLVGYVIFAEDKQMYRLATETKLGLRQGVDVTSATTPGSGSSSGSSNSSNPLNLGLFSSSSSAPALTSPTSSFVPTGNVNPSPTSVSSATGGSANEVRRELRELFRSYA